MDKLQVDMKVERESHQAAMQAERQAWEKKTEADHQAMRAERQAWDQKSAEVS